MNLLELKGMRHWCGCGKKGRAVRGKCGVHQAASSAHGAAEGEHINKFADHAQEITAALTAASDAFVMSTLLWSSTAFRGKWSEERSEVFWALRMKRDRTGRILNQYFNAKIFKQPGTFLKTEHPVCVYTHTSITPECPLCHKKNV